MQTDVPLKLLLERCAADLLPLLGIEGEVVRVETLELPATAARLDSAIWLRSPGGIVYIHILEWQGYRDPTLLWRVIGYKASLLQSSRGAANSADGGLRHSRGGCRRRC